MKNFYISIIFILIAFLFTTQTVNAQYSEQKIFPQNIDENNVFGEDVDIAGDFLICGARGDDEAGNAHGAAYIYYNNDGIWEQHSKLLVEQSQDYDFFGDAVCISENYAVLTSCYFVAGVFTGKIAIFHYNSETNTWEQQFLIEKPVGLPDDAMFGKSCDIDGDNLIIGMRPFDSETGVNGSAYIYNFNGTTWTQTAEITPADAESSDIVGQYVSIAGDYAIISAHCADTPSPNTGYASIFKNIEGTWTEITKIIGQQEGAYFGEGLAMNENYAIIGACEDINANTDQGAVYIYENNGDTWTQTDKLIAPDGEAGARFGSDIAFNNDYLIIGANYTSVLDGYSAAYVYENIDGTWTFKEKIEPADAQAGDRFGDAVAISGNTFVVGACRHEISNLSQSGAAYVYSPAQESSENDITNFDVPNQVGNEIINTTEHTITLNVENGTDLTDLIPTISISDFATINPETGISQNFTTPIEYTVTAENGDEQVWTVTVNLLVGLTYLSENKISIYPNPSTGIFTIKNPAGSLRPAGVSITNMTGKTIKQLLALGGVEVSIDISNQPKGLYFITIQTEKSINTEIIIIQ